MILSPWVTAHCLYLVRGLENYVPHLRGPESGRLLMSPFPVTAQTNFLLLSRSLQRRLAHFYRVCSPDVLRVPFSKLQAAVEEAAFSLFQIPQDPHTAAAMGLPHSLVRQQLRLPLRERTSDLDAAGGYPHHAPPARNIEFSLTMTSLTSSYLPLSCTLPHGTHSRPSMSASTITAPVHRRGTVSNSYPQCLTAGIPMALTFY